MGSILAIFAFCLWGIVPLYWKYLREIPAGELILYRIIFSALFLAPFAFGAKFRSAFRDFHRNPKILAGLAASACLIGFNWFLYVWAVNNNHIVESSLGYFLNPLLSVFLGAAFLREKLRYFQKIAIAFATAGALVLVVVGGQIPWIALLLASSFALYGFIRKILHLSTIPATLWETLFLCIPSVFFLASMHQHHEILAGSLSTGKQIYLAAAGILTTVPLLAFVEAAKRLPLSKLAFFQFLSPTFQFIIGVVVFHEPFGLSQYLAFSLVWIGVGVFLVDLGIRKEKPKLN